MTANEKQNRDALRREKDRKLLAQKQELDHKMRSAKLRFEKKLLDKARKTKEYDAKIEHADKEVQYNVYSKAGHVAGKKHNHVHNTLMSSWIVFPMPELKEMRNDERVHEQ